MAPLPRCRPRFGLRRNQEQAFVHRALAAVSQVVSDCSYRVLLLRSIDELDVSEVAAALGLTPEQVRYRHCRAKRELRRLVETLRVAATGPDRPQPV